LNKLQGFRLAADRSNQVSLNEWIVVNKPVAAGFMPAFKYRQKNDLVVPERGHKARGYGACSFNHIFRPEFFSNQMDVPAEPYNSE
jgi:hypothetical protein